MLVTSFQVFVRSASSFVLTINIRRSAGEVPGLHSHEELEPLLAPLKELMREDGNHKTTYDFFVSRVQQNLHIVLCMASAAVIRMYTRVPQCFCTMYSWSFSECQKDGRGILSSCIESR